MSEATATPALYGPAGRAHVTEGREDVVAASTATGIADRLQLD